MPSAEFFDILDENGNSIGKIKERSRVHADGDWHRTVHVWITNGRGEVLVQKRAAGKQTFPGKWDVSCAGHVTSGDSSRQAAVREAGEELGIKLSPLELRLVCTVKSVYSDAFVHDYEIVDVYVVRRDISVQNCMVQKDEVEAVRLLPGAELERLIAGNNPDYVPHPAEYAKLFSYLRDQYPA